jgi:hypothetical protein
MRLTLALVGLLALVVPDRARADTLTVRLWQFEPDGSRVYLGRRLVAVAADAELRLMIGEPGSQGMVRDHRLDATLAIYDAGDSTVVAGMVVAGRVREGNLVASAAESRAIIEEHRYRLDTRVKRGEPVWFFPFGRPREGERGIGIELARGARSADRDRRLVHPGPVVLIMPELAVVARPAPPLRARLEVGQPGAFTVAYEGPVHALSPITFTVPHAARAAPLAVVLGRRPWFVETGEQCWRWYWGDGKPPSGGACLPPERMQYQTLIHGSGGQLLRLTVLDQ